MTRDWLSEPFWQAEQDAAAFVTRVVARWIARRRTVVRLYLPPLGAW